MLPYTPPKPIMFSQDWAQNRAVIQPTTNATAIRLSRVLRTMGIQNNQFMLSLFDPTLMHIDPHNPAHVTPEIARRIFIECLYNPWYYFREVVRIPTTGGNAVPFEFHRGNLALIWCFYNDMDAFLTLPRQTGKTIATQAIMSHQMYFAGYNYDLAMYTKDQTLLQDNVLRLKDIRDALPPYLLQKNAKGIDKDAKEGISYTAFENRYLTFVNSNNERDAYKLGRKPTLCGHQ